ncbi:MAG: AAA family ATPase [Gammaproteobacteria bacterium]|nr:AAA family ATPase [Gammaproteobacteria bacterium]
MTPGKIILLNGSSSAGKTTIARMLQQLYAEPYQHIALDQFRDGMSERFRGLNSPDGDTGARGLNVVPVEREGERMTEIRFGDVGRPVLRGMRRAIAIFAREGNHVIVDDLMFEKSFLLDYLDALKGLHVTFAGVRCDLAVVNAREATRPGRFPGTATSHFDSVHAHCIYDVEVDTTESTPRQCARQIMRAAESTPRAFDQLREKFGVDC